MGGRSSSSRLGVSSRANTSAGGTFTGESGGTVAAEYRLPTGEDGRTYFAYGSYQTNYTPENFVRDSRNVQLYGGIDFERSGSGYEEQRRIYEESRRRWQKQIQYNREFNNGRRTLTEVSSNKLKTMYNGATSDDVRRRIAAELNARGFYNRNGKWRSQGGGR